MRIKVGLNTKQMDEWKAAYEEGYSAAQRGLNYFQNPYKDDDVRWDGWRRGWTAAECNRGKR